MKPLSFLYGRIGRRWWPSDHHRLAGLTGRRGVILALSCLSGPVAAADTYYNAQKQRLVAAIEAAGCIVHEENHADILIAANLTPEQGSIIVADMMGRGEAEPLGDDLRLKTSGCP